MGVMPKPGDPEYLLTVKELARALRLSPMTVYRLIHTGEIEHVRVGRSYRVRYDDYLKHIKRVTEERRST